MLRTGSSGRRQWYRRRQYKDARPAERETPCKLLIADDQPHILEALRLLLKPEGYELEMVRTPALALEALAGRASTVCSSI